MALKFESALMLFLKTTNFALMLILLERTNVFKRYKASMWESIILI